MVTEINTEKKSNASSLLQNAGNLYLLVREKENRLYTDEEVAILPEIHAGRDHYREWQLRKRSLERFRKYLSKKPGKHEVLEIGCGNGWLSANLARLPGITITAIDINELEMQQAKRVFKDLPNLEFIDGDIRNEKLANRKFDIILLAASLQYFSSVSEIISTAFSALVPGGEIHIIDTPVYKSKELSSAIERSTNYYHRIGIPEMAKNYFHHSFDELNIYDNTLLFKPGGFINKVLGNKDPFPWIIIKQ